MLGRVARSAGKLLGARTTSVTKKSTWSVKSTQQRNATTFSQFTVSSMVNPLVAEQPRKSISLIEEETTVVLRSNFSDMMELPDISNQIPTEVVEESETEQQDEATIQCIKRKYQPSWVRRKRRHGFLVRNRTPGGRNVLKRRIAKGRWRLTV